MPAAKTKSLLPEDQSSVVPLAELRPGQVADCFALLVSRDRATTRDGKPFYRVTFRDAIRSVTVMVWADSAFFTDCEQSWHDGSFYKLRGRYDENSYGPKFELDLIRLVTDDDVADGFDPGTLVAASRFHPEEMYTELTDLVETHIEEAPLRQLVAEILQAHQETIKRIPAAARNHHSYRSGYLEHTLSVTKTAIFLADHYCEYYAGMQPPLSKSLVVAGAVLHDIGKILELDDQPQGATYTAPGRLVGHILLGRDLVLQWAAEVEDLDRETLLRLEHIIVSHQNLPEWGSPIAPHTPEALLVHYADDIDAKFHMMAVVLEAPAVDDEEFTNRDNPLRRPIFRGLYQRD